MRAFLVKSPVRRERRGFGVVPISARGAGAVVARFRIGCMSTRLLTAAEVAELLGVPKPWVYEQSRRGVSPTVALARDRRFREEAIACMVEQFEQRGVGPGT
jgi:excisionase family DNA binding protein